MDLERKVTDWSQKSQKANNNSNNNSNEKVNEYTRSSDSRDIQNQTFNEEFAEHEPTGPQQRWKEDSMRMSNIIEGLESRCKMLQAENQHLEAMVHKYRTEYDVDTSYLKNQVKNERDRQMQWKDLYFKAHAELMDIKRHSNPAVQQQQQQQQQQRNDSKLLCEGTSGTGAWTPRTPRTRTHTCNFLSSYIGKESDCQECEIESRKRKASDSEHQRNYEVVDGYPRSVNGGQDGPSRHSSSESQYAHSDGGRHGPGTPGPGGKGIHPSPVGKPPDEDMSRPPGLPLLTSAADVVRPHMLPHMGLPSQVYVKDEMHHLPSPRESGPPGPGQYFKCHVCGIYYDTQQKLHFHMELHSERYAGGSGGPGVPIPNDIHNDIVSMNSPFDYLICPECNLSFKTDDDYRRHLLVHVFKCRICGLTLENEMSFLVHVKGHGESNTQQPYHCFLCDKQFSHVSHLTRHVLTHPDEQPFECVECGKRFARKGHLTRHMTMHSKCRPYTCQDCGKTFAHRTHLRRHEIVHSGLRPHKCRVCQQSFSRKSSLSRHYFIHTTEKPFVCPVCEKGFNRKGRLKNHLKIHIREGYPDLVDYVIERRPITKEFIEKINMVKPEGEDSADFASSSTSKDGVPEGSGFSGGFRPSDKVNVDGDDDDDQLPGIKEESDDDDSSSDSEGENDEEADMSEEISYFEPTSGSDTMVTMVPSSSSSSSTSVKKSMVVERVPTPRSPALPPSNDTSPYSTTGTPPYHTGASGVDYLAAAAETLPYSTGNGDSMVKTDAVVQHMSAMSES
jgi:hypothetical protein